MVPADARSCTDFFCLLVFFAAVGTMCFFGIDGLMNGNPNKLFAPLDAANNFCGIDEEFADYPFLWVKLSGAGLDIKGIFDTGVCVKTCPQKDEVTDCKINAALESQECQTSKYPTKEAFGFCMPTDAPEDMIKNIKMLKESLMKGKSGAIIQDIISSEKTIVLSILSAFFVSLAFIQLMSAAAECIAWVSIVLL